MTYRTRGQSGGNTDTSVTARKSTLLQLAQSGLINRVLLGYITKPDDSGTDNIGFYL
jgi:hypothetical protein